MLEQGAVLNGIIRGSPFDQAGLMPGDIVLSLNGIEILESRWYHNVLKGFAPGETVRVSYWRDGTTRSVEVTSVLRVR